MKTVLPLAAIAILLTAGTVMAKPKINGCTYGQLGGNAAKACVRQGERDLIRGSSRVHAVACTSTGKMFCCEYGSDNKPKNCQALN